MNPLAATIAILAALSLLTYAAPQATAPMPDSKAFLEATRLNLTRAQQEQDNYSYKERRTDVHVNPFGRLGTGGSRIYEVTPGPDRSVFYRKLIERDGTAVEDSKLERQERRSRTQAKTVVDDAVGSLALMMESGAA